MINYASLLRIEVNYTSRNSRQCLLHSELVQIKEGLLRMPGCPDNVWTTNMVSNMQAIDYRGCSKKRRLIPSEKMTKSKEVFLFGAGAGLDWNGPTTNELTNLVRNSGFKLKNSDTKITEYIYQKLIESNREENEVNFETIINVIEELLIYFSEYSIKSKSPSLIRTFVPKNDLSDILNYSIKGGNRSHGYLLQIPMGVDYDFAQQSLNDENPDQFFLQHLLSAILTDISARISEYAYHTPSSSVVLNNSSSSLLFKKWVGGINNKSIIRLYTLNYDRIFKILLQDEGIQCFEGFNVPDNSDCYLEVRSNPTRIVTEFEEPCYYNLHGSVFWRVLAHDYSQLPNPEIVYSGFPNLPDNDEQSYFTMEKGKPVYLSNIITGYQKTQKSAMAPYRHMHSAFDRDCIECNCIYVVGYSFGDEHINESIKTALRHNKNLRIEIVDPNFITSSMDYNLNLTLFRYIGNDHIDAKKIDNNKYSYYQGKVLVYNLRFEDYLNIKVNDGYKYL